jgi:hypothetical protein
MKKDNYVGARLILKPTGVAAAKMENGKAGIQGPLTGTLVVTSLGNWKNGAASRRAAVPSRIKVTGWLEPKSTLTTPPKAKALSARRQKEQ